MTLEPFGFKYISINVGLNKAYIIYVWWRLYFSFPKENAKSKSQLNVLREVKTMRTTFIAKAAEVERKWYVVVLHQKLLKF